MIESTCNLKLLEVYSLLTSIRSKLDNFDTKKILTNNYSNNVNLCLESLVNNTQLMYIKTLKIILNLLENKLKELIIKNSSLAKY